MGRGETSSEMLKSAASTIYLREVYAKIATKDKRDRGIWCFRLCHGAVLFLERLSFRFAMQL